MIPLVPVPLTLKLGKRRRDLHSLDRKPKRTKKKKLTIRKSTFKHSLKTKTWINHNPIVRKGDFRDENMKQMSKATFTNALNFGNDWKSPPGSKRHPFNLLSQNVNAQMSKPATNSKLKRRPKRARKQKLLKPKCVYHSNVYKNVSLFELTPGEYQWLGWINNIDNPVVDDGVEKTCAEKLDTYCKEKGISIANTQVPNQEHVIREKKHVRVILKSRVNSLTGDREFLAQWSGDDNCSTWEPEIALSNCDALKQFLEKEKKNRDRTISISNERKFDKKVKIVSIKKEAQVRRLKLGSVKQEVCPTPAVVELPPIPSSMIVQIVEDCPKEKKVEVGDQVKCSNNGHDWVMGVVTEVEPNICMKCVGFKKSHQFGHVRLASHCNEFVPLTPWVECRPFFGEGQKIFVLSSSGCWRQCTVIDQSDSQILINYSGFPDRFNEFLSKTSDRIIIDPIVPYKDKLEYTKEVQEIFECQEKMMNVLDKVQRLLVQQRNFEEQKRNAERLSGNNELQDFFNEETSYLEDQYWSTLRSIIDATEEFHAWELDIKERLKEASSKCDSDFIETYLKFKTGKLTDVEIEKKRTLIFEALRSSGSTMTKFLLTELEIITLQLRAEIYSKTIEPSATDFLSE